MLINHFIDYSRTTKDIWRRLACEGKFDVIELLKRVEKEEGGYGTIIIPSGGFSNDEITNRLIIMWLEKKDVNVYSVEEEIKEYEEALYCKI